MFKKSAQSKKNACLFEKCYKEVTSIVSFVITKFSVGVLVTVDHLEKILIRNN